MPTWFLPPDFTFAADGPLQLGNVIKHPSKPTDVLTVLSSQDCGITLPKTNIITEKDHQHSRSHGHSNGLDTSVEAFALASASIKTSISKNISIDYSAVDHEIHTFAGPLTAEMAGKIAALPTVQKYISSGMLFEKRPVYVITGLRIAKEPFSVKTETGRGHSVKLSGSGPPVPGLELGAGVSHLQDRNITDSYKTAPGIVFAYQVYVVRHKRAGAVMQLFSSNAAFMSGIGADQDDGPPIVVEGTMEEIHEDLLVRSECKETRIGDDIYVSF